MKLCDGRDTVRVSDKVPSPLRLLVAEFGRLSEALSVLVDDSVVRDAECDIAVSDNVSETVAMALRCELLCERDTEMLRGPDVDIEDVTLRHDEGVDEIVTEDVAAGDAVSEYEVMMSHRHAQPSNAAPVDD